MADAKQAGGAAHAHAGHRQRMRGKVFSGGMDSMPPHELIEFLLFYAIPKRDVNALAHALLNEFGSLERLFTADESELRRVPGIGSGAAKLIVAYGAAMRQYLDSRAVSTDWTFSVPGAIETANAHFVHPTRQEMAALFMNPDYIARVFREQQGISLNDYIRTRRISRAKRLLRETNLPLSEICAMVGHTYNSYFFNNFKKATGLSPMEYRNQYKK